MMCCSLPRFKMLPSLVLVLAGVPKCPETVVCLAEKTVYGWASFRKELLAPSSISLCSDWSSVLWPEAHRNLHGEAGLTAHSEPSVCPRPPLIALRPSDLSGSGDQSSPALCCPCAHLVLSTVGTRAAHLICHPLHR